MKSVHKERLSIVRLETVGAEIANAINDLPKVTLFQILKTWILSLQTDLDWVETMKEAQ